MSENPFDRFSVGDVIDPLEVEDSSADKLFGVEFMEALRKIRRETGRRAVPRYRIVEMDRDSGEITVSYRRDS